MKISKKHFELFKKECKYWQKRLELNSYKFYYHLGGNSEEAFCTIRIKQVGRVVSLFLAKDFYDEDDLSINDKIKETAKHEMIHALLGRMSSNVYTRFVSEYEAEESEEEVVRKLEIIIN